MMSFLSNVNITFIYILFFFHLFKLIFPFPHIHERTAVRTNENYYIFSKISTKKECIILPGMGDATWAGGRGPGEEAIGEENTYLL